MITEKMVKELLFKKMFYTCISILAQSASSPKRKKQHKKYRSVISDIFDGTIISSVQCLTCDRVSMSELKSAGNFCQMVLKKKTDKWDEKFNFFSLLLMVIHVFLMFTSA